MDEEEEAGAAILEVIRLLCKSTFLRDFQFLLWTSVGLSMIMSLVVDVASVLVLGGGGHS